MPRITSKKTAKVNTIVLSDETNSISDCTFSDKVTFVCHGESPDARFFHRLVQAMNLLFRNRIFARTVYIKNCVMGDSIIVYNYMKNKQNYQ